MPNDFDGFFILSEQDSTPLFKAPVIDNLLEGLARPEFDAASSGDNGDVGAESLTVSHTVGSGSSGYLIACLMVANSVTNEAATFNGEAMTLLATEDTSTGELHMFGLANPDAGTHDIVFTWTTSRRCIGTAVSYFGVGSVGTPQTSDGSGATASVTISSGAYDVIVDCVQVYRATSSTAPGASVGADQTERVTETVINGGTTSFRQSMSSEDGDGGNIDMTWSLTNQTDWNQIAIALQP